MAGTWTKPLAHGPPIPRPPSVFEGTLSEYIDRVLLPALPDRRLVLRWHDALRAHADRTDATFLVRATPGFKQEDELVVRGRRVRMTDNASFWWMHAAAFAGLAPPDDGLKSVLDDVWCWMFRAHAGTPARPGHANAAGWYLAHLLPAKPSGQGEPTTWSAETLRQRFLRNVSPLNQFLVPVGNGRVTGEDPEVIATVLDAYRGRYGTAFTRFLDEAGARPEELGAPAWAKRLRFEAATDKPRADSAPKRSVVRTPSPTPRRGVTSSSDGGLSAGDLVILVRAPDDPDERYPNRWVGRRLDVLATHAKVVGAIRRALDDGHARVFVQTTPSGRILGSARVGEIAGRGDVWSVTFVEWCAMDEAPAGRSYGAAWYRVGAGARD